MKFKSKTTGAILEPASDMVVEQMKKSPDFEIVAQGAPDAPQDGANDQKGKNTGKGKKPAQG